MLHRRSTFSSSMNRLRWRWIEFCPYKYLPSRAIPPCRTPARPCQAKTAHRHTLGVARAWDRDGEGHNAAHRNGIAEHLRIVVTLITTPITTNGSCCDMPTLCAYLPVHRLSDARSGMVRPRCVSMQDSEARWRVVAYRPTYLSHVGTPYVNMRVYMSRFSASLSTS
jgi:hypothetical protein